MKQKLRDLSKGDEDTRRGTIIDVSRSRDVRYLPQLLRALDAETSYENRRHVVRAIGQLGPPEAVEMLRGLVSRESGLILGDFVLALARCGDAEVGAVISRLREHSLPWVRDCATRAERECSE